MGRDAIVTFDMGGTTAKASLVEEGRVDLTEELEVGDALNRGGGFMRGAGHVVRAACVDLTEVGSGGGSIAWIDGGGALRVGPRSAGSSPGPACYDDGGTDATVTDAHVVLGWVNPEAIAGGTKPLRADLAQAAVGRLAERLGLSVEDTAHGIVTIATATMRRAVRAVSVERGRDARLHSLVAFGGAGGLHAAALAEEMEMPEVIVPVVAGLFSSLGLLFADIAVMRVAALRLPLGEETRGQLGGVAARLAAEAVEELCARHGAGDADGDVGTVEVLVNLRYVGQLSTLMLPFDAGADLGALTDAFHREHRRAYGQSAEDEAVEVVAVRARAVRGSSMPSFAELAREELRREPEAPCSRSIYLGPALGRQEAVVLTRVALVAGPVAGPAVIEEPEATVLVPPGFVATLDATGSVVLTRDAP
jgi:N-methylhydantoinase A